MGMEPRRNNSYYYRKRREGNHVISEYIGGGSLGVLAANFDESKWEERMVQRAQERKMQASLAAIEQDLDAFNRNMETLLHAVLICSGFHAHKGQWRRKRDQTI